MTGHRSYAERYSQIMSKPGAAERIAKLRQQIDEEQERYKRREEFIATHGVTPEEMLERVRAALPSPKDPADVLRSRLDEDEWEKHLARAWNIQTLSELVQQLDEAMRAVELASSQPDSRGDASGQLEDLPMDAVRIFSSAAALLDWSVRAAGGHAKITAVFEDEEIPLKVG
jgi:hypothetical protein